MNTDGGRSGKTTTVCGFRRKPVKENNTINKMKSRSNLGLSVSYVARHTHRRRYRTQTTPTRRVVHVWATHVIQ